MRFRDIKGNEAAVGVLRGMVDSDRIPHALLFYENPGSGGMAIAQAFLQYLYCTDRKDGDACGECPSCQKIAKLIHPDVHYVFPVNEGDVIKGEHPVSAMGIGTFRELFCGNPYFGEQDLYSALGMTGKAGNISVYEAKELLSCLSLSAVQDGWRSVVMFLPERMNQAAANKLLKLLEEPPAQTLFILITQNPEDVMSTIYSRCQGLRILPFDRSSIYMEKVSEELSMIWKNMFEAIVAGKLAAALDCADDIAAIKSRDTQKSFCAYASGRIRQLFLHSKGLDDIAYVDSCDPPAAVNLSSAFCLAALEIFDRAAYMLGRNVSAKMVFTDMVNRLFLKMQNGR